MPIKFCSEAYFVRIEVFLTSLKSQTRDLCSGFLHHEKIHRPQPGLNPRTLDLETTEINTRMLITSVIQIKLAIEGSRYQTSSLNTN